LNQSKDIDESNRQREVFADIIQFRRSNRAFDPNIEVPDDVIRQALEHAILSPNSSNMQLWEFHWIATKDMLDAFIPLCLDQQAAKTAKYLMVFVTRQDLWKQRAEWNVQQIESAIQGEANTFQKAGLNYYKKLMPIMYMPSNETMTVMPANKTARPAVSIATAVASSGDSPERRPSRKRVTIKSA
jgi:nitroreductase